MGKAKSTQNAELEKRTRTDLVEWVGKRKRGGERGGGVLQVSCKLKPELERSLAAY